MEVVSLKSTSDNLHLETPIQQSLRINLIRHWFARTTVQKKIKLFKSFITALRKADRQLTILPFYANKQQYTSLTTIKQIESLNEHQLSLYFNPWFKELALFSQCAPSH